MNHYQDFKNMIRRELLAVYGDQAHVEFRQLPKNNCELQDTVCILPEGKNIAPVLCLKPIYDDYCSGKPAADIINEIVRTVERGENVSYPVDGLSEWDNVRERIGAKLIASQGNADLLKTVPHRLVSDLALVYYIYFNQEKAPVGTAVVSLQNMELWGINEEDLYEASRKNLPELLPARVYCMEDMLQEMLLGGRYEAENLLETPETGIPVSGSLYVVTNHRRWFGAVALFYEGVMRQIMDRLGWDEAYIIPSSVHEMLLAPVYSGKASELAEMIREVNDSSVEPEDRLTYSLYHYSRADDCLTRAAGRGEETGKLFSLFVA